MTLKLNKMKKQSNLSRPHTGKLSLNKKTISNLNEMEMFKKVGGEWTHPCGTYGCGGGRTRNGNTCPGHNTCNSCVNTCYPC